MSSAVDSDTFADIVRSRRFSIGNRCIFFDTEFQNLFRIYQDLSDVMTSIKKRIERKDIEDVSASKFAYFDSQRNRHLAPDVLYNFTCDKDICRVVRVRKEYFVYCSFVDFGDKRIYRKIPNVCGPYSLDVAVSTYNDLIHDYYMRKYDGLF